MNSASAHGPGPGRGVTADVELAAQPPVAPTSQPSIQHRRAVASATSSGNSTDESRTPLNRGFQLPRHSMGAVSSSSSYGATVSALTAAHHAKIDNGSLSARDVRVGDVPVVVFGFGNSDGRGSDIGDSGDCAHAAQYHEVAA